MELHPTGLKSARKYSKNRYYNYPEYNSWTSMKTRCYNKNSARYYLYGERGVRVCSRWLNSFENFITDMGRRPLKNHSLDRFPNMNGDYCPENCRWATPQEQARNRRSNLMLSNGKELLCLADWANKLDVDYEKLRKCLHDGTLLSQMLNSKGELNIKYHKLFKGGFWIKNTKEVGRFTSAGKLIKTFKSIKEAANHYGMCYYTLGKYLNGKEKKVKGGLIFKFINLQSLTT